MRLLRTLTWVLVVLVGITLIVGALALSDQYRDRIYPGVTIDDLTGVGLIAGPLDVGGLPRRAARDRLASRLASPDSLGVTLQVGEVSWKITWAMVGQSYDVEDAVARAFTAGRERLRDREQPWWLGFTKVLIPRSMTISISTIPADPALVREHVEEIAEIVKTEPSDADLVVSDGQVSVVPAQNGQWIDVDVATSQVLEALAQGTEEVTLVPDTIAADIPAAEPAYSQAQALLRQPFIVEVSDPLTGDPALGGFHAEFAASPQVVGSWLRPLRHRGRITLNFDTRAVLTWAQGIAPQVGEERTLNSDLTAVRVLEALRSGDTNRAEAVVTHPPFSYTVQFGDTFFDIAYAHGFPQWRLQQANPDVDPGLIDVGQVLTIPSIDVLFPLPLVKDKRIEIDLPTQTLRAYDGDVQHFEFKVSSGISTTPTLAGQFQILFKEEMAFAQRWHLDMPYFMGFYAEGEDFYNGIHELPITSYGTRLSPYVLGWPASYGCIILNVGDAEALYNWADLGTLVRVNGVAPGTPFGQQTLEDIAPLIETPAP